MRLSRACHMLIGAPLHSLLMCIWYCFTVKYSETVNEFWNPDLDSFKTQGSMKPWRNAWWQKYSVAICSKLNLSLPGLQGLVHENIHTCLLTQIVIVMCEKTRLYRREGSRHTVYRSVNGPSCFQTWLQREITKLYILCL